jgi:hemerythrin-like domain-containing protein
LLRERFAKAESQGMASSEITRFSQELSAHIRKEERQLFERMQELMKPDQLELMGQSLEEALKEAEQACILPAKSPRDL